METINHKPIEPVYQQDKPNGSIELGTYAVNLRAGRESYPAELHVESRFQRTPKVQFRTIGDTAFPAHIGGFGEGQQDSIGIEFIETNVTVDVLLTGTSISSSEATRFSFTPKNEPVQIASPCSKLTYALVHVFNFPRFYGDKCLHATFESKVNDTKTTRQTRAGYAILQANDWVFELVPLIDVAGREKRLSETGGYLLTHMLKVSKSNGETFSSADLDEQVQLLYYYLSFVTGRWVGMGFDVGFADDESIRWQQWGLRLSTPNGWGGESSWFSHMRGQILEAAFPGFASLWRQEPWKESLRKAIYWYLAANKSDPWVSSDTSLVLAQTSLELLAWTHCVCSRKIVTEDAFGRRGLSAANKIRLLLSTCGIPHEISMSLDKLNAVRGNSFKDGPDAVTSIRNQLVHPSAKQKKLLDEQLYQASTLALWYVEMVLLSITGYQGVYADRRRPRWVGEVQNVPWACDAATGNDNHRP